ncbi:hypothetical protein BGZ47_011739 [Haplosporangium gracile]|nr:hypothetical protein BGZ47_011739 [Haplosporangium gracile]
MFEPIPPSSLLKIYKGCSNCRTQKIKCNGQEPCSRCSTFGLQCQYIVLPNQAAHRLAALAAGVNTPNILPAPTTTPASTSPSSPSPSSPSPSLSLSSSAAAAAAAAFSTTTTTTAVLTRRNTLASISTTTLSATTSPTPSPTTPIATNSATNTITSWSTDDSIKSGSRITSSSAHSPKSRASRKKGRSAVSSRKKSDHGRHNSISSPVAMSSSPAEFSSDTPDSTMLWLTSPNAIMQSLMDAADPDLYAYKSFVAADNVSPTPAILRELVGFYLQYMHPIHGLVDPQAPDFWTRLDLPMEPKVASIVYAMCTIGAIFKSSTPSPGVRDDLVYEFYRRTWSLKDKRPRDIVTIQTILIMHSFFDLTSQVDEANSSFRLMADIADEIELGTHVLELVHREKLSKKDILVRNTWRLLVWNEVMGFMISKQSSKIVPTKDLSNNALDVRPDEIPGSKAPIAEVVHYHLGNLFKIFQSITRIKLPMSPRDLHAVTNILDTFTAWHSDLPKYLRGPGSRTTFASEKGDVSPSAYTLDLYFRLGHILLLNSLPSSVRSSPTGLGPRRESPLRILATCANGITATVGDLIKEPELRNYCMAHGLRCLTEAAMLQLANSKELDPAISTPAKVNFMKTLWCIRQFNFALPLDVLNLTLAPFDTVGKIPSSSSNQDIAQTELSKESFRPRTSSVSSVSMESPVFSAPSRTKREISLASDYSSSTTSAQEGSHPTIFEADEPDTKHAVRIAPVSPLQDGAAASLLALSLESPTTLPSLATNALAYNRPPEGPPHGMEMLTNQAHSLARDEYEGDRSRSSSISVLSLRTESPNAHHVSFTDVQSHPVTSQRSPLPPLARRELADSHLLHIQDYRPPSDTHPHPLSPRQSRADLQRPLYHRSMNTFPPHQESSWTTYDSHHHRGVPAHDDGFQSRAPMALPSSSPTTGSAWPPDMPGTELYGPGQSFHYDGDSALPRSDQLRPSVFPSTSSAYGTAVSHDRGFMTGSGRSLLASERQDTSNTQYARHDESHQHGAPLWRTASEHSSQQSGPHTRPKEHDQRSPKETRHLREIRLQSNTRRDMDPYRAQQQLSDFYDQFPSRLHGPHHPSRHLDSSVAAEQDPKRLFFSVQHTDSYFSSGVSTSATHLSPEYASRALAQGAPTFPADRLREPPLDSPDAALPPSHRQDPESVRARLGYESRLEEQARLRHQYQQHHHHSYHRHSIDESMMSLSTVPTRTPMEQPSRGDTMKMGLPEQESSQSVVDMSSPQWSISPQSTTARPIAMPSSRAGSRRSSVVIWQESPRFREALGRDRGTGSGSEEPFLGGGGGQNKGSVSSEGRAELTPSLYAGRKRPSVSMYASVGDEHAALLLRSRGGGAVADSGHVYLQRGPDSGQGISAESRSSAAYRAAVAYNLDPLHQDGQGNSRLLEKRQSSSTHALERQEQGVDLGLSGITPSMRYTQPGSPRDQQQHPLGGEQQPPVDYHRQYRSTEHPQQGRPLERHQPYSLYRSVYPLPPSPHSQQQDARLYRNQEIPTSYDPTLSSHSLPQHRSMPIPHPLVPVQSAYPHTTTPTSQPPPSQEWPPTDTRAALGPQSSRNDGHEDADETTFSGYSELIRDPVRRKYR